MAQPTADELRDIHFRYGGTYIRTKDNDIYNLVDFDFNENGKAVMTVAMKSKNWKTKTIPYEDIFSNNVFPESKLFNHKLGLYKATRVVATRGYKKAVDRSNVAITNLCTNECAILESFQHMYGKDRELNNRTAPSFYDDTYPSIDEALEQIISGKYLGRALSTNYGVRISEMYNTIVLLHFVVGDVGFINEDGLTLFKSTKFLVDEIMDSSILSRNVPLLGVKS